MGLDPCVRCSAATDVSRPPGPAQLLLPTAPGPCASVVSLDLGAGFCEGTHLWHASRPLHPQKLMPWKVGRKWEDEENNRSVPVVSLSARLAEKQETVEFLIHCLFWFLNPHGWFSNIRIHTWGASTSSLRTVIAEKQQGRGDKKGLGSERPDAFLTPAF